MPTLMLRETLISYDSKVSHYTVPPYIRNIAENCFYDKAYLKHLTMPERMDSIGDNAFRMCFNMTGIDMPQVCASVGKSLFRECRRLRQVALPEGTREIDRYMFFACDDMEEICLPGTVERVDESAFSGCGRLRRLILPPEHIMILPEAVRLTAAISYMSRHTQGAGNPEMDRFVSSVSAQAARLAIQQGEPEAIRYMLTHELIRPAEIPEHIREANDMCQTEIAAILLGYRKPAESVPADAEWDPFA